MKNTRQQDTSSKPEPIKLLVYPLAPDNPYQILLYDALAKNNLVVAKMLKIPTSLAGFLFQIFDITYQLMISRVSGYRLIHLHWLYQLGFPGKPIWPWMSRAITTLQIRFFLFFSKLLGYKIVWTVHDIVPHYRMALNDVAITQKLLDHSSKLILLSSSTIQEIDAREFDYDKNKLVIVPHGNYIGSYANAISMSAARQRLGIPEDALVYLFFGTTQPYKNVSGMLKAFQDVVKQQSRTVCIIAGKVSSPELLSEIEAAKERLGERLKLYPDYIPDEDVQVYFNAADFVVFPYLRITNSGVALLSASFAKPVIAPLIGAFKDLPKPSGIFYEAGSQKELTEAMLEAFERKASLNAMSAAAESYAKSLSWDAIALQTYHVYKSTAE